LNIVAEHALGRNKNTWLFHQETAPPPLSMFFDYFTAYMYEEMRQCYLNCLDHSAIVAGCVALEAVIKSTSYQKWFVEHGRHHHNSRLWNKIDGMEFGTSINYARRIGLISKRFKKRLCSFRGNVRNKYLHGETPTEVKDAIWKNVGIFNVKTQKTDIRDLELKGVIHLQRLARIINDRNLAPFVVAFVHEAIGKLYVSLEEIQLRNELVTILKSRLEVAPRSHNNSNS
jgi:hypothetical protein